MSKAKVPDVFMPFDELDMLDGCNTVSLDTLITVLESARRYYGVNSVVRFDSAPTNLSVEIAPSKKSVLGKPKLEYVSVTRVSEWQCPHCASANTDDDEVSINEVLTCYECKKQFAIGDID